MTISALPNEALVAEAFKNTVSENGLYILPWSTDMSEEAMAEFDQKIKNGIRLYDRVPHPMGLKSARA
jgi:hypothetical protein